MMCHVLYVILIDNHYCYYSMRKRTVSPLSPEDDTTPLDSTEQDAMINEFRDTQVSQQYH